MQNEQVHTTLVHEQWSFTFVVQTVNRFSSRERSMLRKVTKGLSLLDSLNPYPANVENKVSS